MSLPTDTQSLLTQFLQSVASGGGVTTVFNRVAFASGSATITDTAVSLTGLTGIDAAELAQARVLWLTVSANTLRFWLDGATPTTGNGHTWSDVKGILVIQGAANIQAFRMVRNSSSDANVQATLFR